MKLMKKSEKDVVEKIFFCPTGTPSSKNSRRWTGKRFLPSKATSLWRIETEEWWKENKDLFKKELENLEKPYLIGMHFVRKSKHKFDIINPMQTVQDEMVAYDYIDDDNTDEMIPIPLSIDGQWYTYSKENPGVYIKVFSKKEEIEALTKLTNIKI
jgi:hypothetical protein